MQKNMKHTKRAVDGLTQPRGVEALQSSPCHKEPSMKNEGALRTTANLEHEQVPQRRPKERPRNGSPSRAKGVPYFNALTVGEKTVGSNFASRIPARSARARCHCSHFSHALMPAL